MIIQTPTNKLEYSLDFYKKLNFKLISEASPILFSDGKAVIEINPERMARAGVKFMNEDWTSQVAALEKLTPVYKLENGYVISDTTGMWIYLKEGKSSPPLEITGECTSLLGNFAGLSLETISISHSSKIWKILDFKTTMGGQEQGWMTLEDKTGNTISLMNPGSCPHLFFNPSLTYFNGKNNPKIIAKIRELGIPITEEITHFNKDGIVDNIIIRDPGGFGFFIFND